MCLITSRWLFVGLALHRLWQRCPGGHHRGHGRHRPGAGAAVAASRGGCNNHLGPVPSLVEILTMSFLFVFFSEFLELKQLYTLFNRVSVELWMFFKLVGTKLLLRQSFSSRARGLQRPDQSQEDLPIRARQGGRRRRSLLGTAERIAELRGASPGYDGS